MLIRRKFSVLFEKFTRQFCSRNNFDNLIIDRIGCVTSIGLNFPKKKNCLNTATIKQLQLAFKEFDESESKVAVLYGEGGNFSSGFDIDEILKDGYHKLESSVDCWKRSPLSKKPVICAVSGYAVAEGFELALICDLRVIEDTAQMGFLGRRFGTPLSLEGGSRLSNLIGQSRAMNLIITGSTIDGITANDWGLAAKSVATGTALGQSINLAQCIGKFPQYAIEYDRFNTIKQSTEGFVAKDLIKLQEKVSNEILINLPKFKKGIGKHGKYKNLLKLETPIWDDDKFIRDSSKS